MRLLLLLAPALLAAAPPELDERIRRVENGLLPAVVAKGQPIPKMKLADRMKHYNAPGVSLAVINNYSIEWARSYGVKRAGSTEPVTLETLFLAGSISKPVAAVAALRLVQQGKLSLDEDVNRKLKSWRVPENEFTREKKVTLRGLLSHSAGLTIHGFPGYAAAAPVPTLVQILDGVKPANTRPIRADLVPGTRERYSGGGYCVMQQLLIDVVGAPFPEFMRETVLRKLEMTRSTYQNPLPEERVPAAATGHYRDATPVKGHWHTYPEMAAAGLWTTPSDLARFVIEIQKARLGKSNRVLSAAIVSQMLTRQVGSFGLGLSLDGKDRILRFGHGGADEGFQAFLVGSMEGGQGAVVMTNSENGIRLSQEILLSLAAEYNWPDHKPREEEKPPAARDEATLEWRQFRGPNASGVSAAADLPVEFGPAKNVVWKTALPPGASSPVLSGDRIFLTAYEGRKLQTICLDRNTGAILWRREMTAQREEVLNKLNDPASPTPVTDGDNVYVFFGNFGLVSYSADGRQRWTLPLGPFTNLHGMAASPILAEGRLLQVCDQDVGSFLHAVDPGTGRVLWKTPRPEFTHGYSTPIVYRPAAAPAQLIAPGAYQLASYSIATGEKLWWAGGMTWQVKSSPVIGDGVLYFNGWAPGGDPGEQYDLPPFDRVLKERDANGDGKIAQEELPKPWWPTGTWGAVDLDDDGLLNERDWSFFRARRASTNSIAAIRLGGRGDLTSTHLLWRFRKSLPDVPCPLLYNNVLYLVRTGGIATSLNPATGEVYKQARLTGALDGYYASPIGVDGKVYLASQAGKIVVLKAATEWEVLAVNQLDDDAHATPAPAPGRLYVRTRSALYCFGKK